MFYIQYLVFLPPVSISRTLFAVYTAKIAFCCYNGILRLGISATSGFILVYRLREGSLQGCLHQRQECEDAYSKGRGIRMLAAWAEV